MCLSCDISLYFGKRSADGLIDRLLEILLLLEHVTEIYATWQYLFNLNVIGETGSLGSGALIEGHARFATT